MTEQSDFEFIFKILSNNSPMTAKEIAKEARSYGRSWQRTEANSALYRMLIRGLVEKIEVEGVVAPKWKLPNGKTLLEVPVSKVSVVARRPKQKPLDPVNLPLQNDPNLSINIQGVEIQFSVDDSMSEHDPYMHGDWLNEKIFVSLNPNHPFWTAFVVDDQKMALYTTLIAEEVYVQWQVSRRESPITPDSLHSIRDKAMRDIAVHSRASRIANAD